MQWMMDPWGFSLVIILIAMLLITLYHFRIYVREALLLAWALPQALFKKLFGEPPDH